MLPLAAGALQTTCPAACEPGVPDECYRSMQVLLAVLRHGEDASDIQLLAALGCRTGFGTSAIARLGKELALIPAARP